MRSFLYTLGGLCIFTEISMFMRATNGFESFSFIYITTMVIIAVAAFFLFTKANSLLSQQKVISTQVENKSITTPEKFGDDKIESVIKPVQQKDYLIESNLDREILRKDSVRLYLDLLEEPTTSKSDKELISDFLMPYRISLVKYGFNKEFYELPDLIQSTFNEDDLYLGRNGYRYVSPSLKIIGKNPDLKVRAYPDYFFIAFPDVVYWALETEILKVNQMLSFYTDAELIIDGFANPDILKKIINLYLKSTKNELECRIIDHYQLV